MKSTSKAAGLATPARAMLAIEAHAGLDRWKRFTTLAVHAARYFYDLREFSGIVFPTKRMIFPRQPDGHSTNKCSSH